MNGDRKKRGLSHSRLLTMLAIAFFFFGSNSAMANQTVSDSSHGMKERMQAKTINGIITDNKGEPIVGASLLEKGTTNGTITNLDGKFSLNVQQGATIVISYVGYTAKEITVGSSTVYNVTLEEDALALEEVVVTAMGIRKEKKALGYSVSDINSEELLKNKQTNVINSLAGKIPGVNVSQAGGAAGAGSNIIIRGGNSASESRDNQPLFVVDGVIYDNSTVNAGNSGTDRVTSSATTFSNRVMDINPEDIESMSVLKGAAAAALYGSRAADGVIIITTKKGQEGALKINVSSKATVSWVKDTPDIQGVYGRGFYNESGAFSDFTMKSWGDKITGNVYDNVDGFFDTGTAFDNNVSVSGGTKNGTFYISVANFMQDGIVPETSFEKNTFRLNAEQKYGILTVGANISYSRADTKKTLTSAGLYDMDGNGAMTALYGWPRSDDMKHWLNEDGTKYRMFEGLQELSKDTENPYWIINRNKLKDVTNRFSGSVNVGLKLTDWWDVSVRAGLDKYSTDARTYLAPGGAIKETYQNGYLSKSKADYEYRTTNFMSNMQKGYGDFDFGLLLGATSEDTKRTNWNHWGYDFITPGTASFSNIASGNQFFKDRTTRKRMLGVFGEARASYKSMAYLTVTGRNDWSSTLPKDNRSYFYPSVSGSFVFTELLPESDIFSFGKIRASWAEVGKDANIYATNTYLRDVGTLNGGVIGTGNEWTGGNPNLKPEKQRSYEFGTELRFFNGRLTFDYTYYQSKTKNQLSSPRLAQSTGYIFITLNGGSVKNKGSELSISGKPIVTKDFQWESTLNLSHNKGRLGSFVDGVDIFYVTDAQIGGVRAGSIPNNGYFLGLTGDRFFRETQVVQGVDAEGKPTSTVEEMGNGRYVIDQSTGLYKHTNATTNVVGNREPKMIGGLNNSFTYKNLNLSFLLDFRLGGDVYNGTEYYLVDRGMSPATLNRESVTFTGVVNNGTEAAPIWEEKTITYQANQMYDIDGKGTMKSGLHMIQKYYEQSAKNSPDFITETNWVRLRNISLSYDFKDFLKRQNIIKGLSATISGNNLLLFTNYKGLDPETSLSSGTGGSGSSGIEYCSVPSTASVSFGVNITF